VYSRQMNGGLCDLGCGTGLTGAGSAGWQHEENVASVAPITDSGAPQLGGKKAACLLQHRDVGFERQVIQLSYSEVSMPNCASCIVWEPAEGHGWHAPGLHMQEKCRIKVRGGNQQKKSRPDSSRKIIQTP
jgi:hypothetical protein